MRRILNVVLLALILALSACSINLLSFKEKEIGLLYDESYQLEPTIYLEGIEYSSSDEKIVRVTEDGLLLALDLGEVTITAKHNDNSVEIFVYVIEAKVMIAVDEEYQLNSHLTVDSLTYSTTDSERIEVSSDGLLKGKKNGRADVIITTPTKEFIITITIRLDGAEEGKLNVYFIDVGQGDAIFLELPNGETMMIDAGHGNLYGKSRAWANVQTVLNDRLNGELDHLVITHNHADHYALVPDIINTYGVKNIYASGSTRTNQQYYNIMRSIQQAGLQIQVLSVGDFLIGAEGDEFFIQVVATQQVFEEDEPNFSSVMLRLIYRFNSFMFTGDGGFWERPYKDAEWIALESGLDLQADVLKVGHHGSRHSSGNDFLAKVRPKYGILTTAKNTSDGLPTSEAMDRLTNIGAVLFQTKDYGTIRVISDGENYEFYNLVGDMYERIY